MANDVPDLTPKQTRLLDVLPAHIDEISDSLSIERSTVRDHIEGIREKGIDLQYDRTANQWYMQDERAPTLERISSKHKSQITREANEIIEAEHSYLLRRLEQTDPLTITQPTRNNEETFVGILGDIHFGDVTEDDRGHKTYDMDTATESVEQFGRKCLEMHDLERETQTYNDAVLIITGDVATGTHIYSGQVHDIEAYLADQVTESAQALIDLIITLSERFETLQVYGVLGNHGLDRASAARGSNTDLLTYRWMQDGLRRMNVNNVEIQVADGSHDLTTRINGQTVHIRHGQRGQKHVDKTAASSRDWRGIWADTRDPVTNRVGFDIAVRGHFHDPSLDYLMGSYPVFTNPSPKPGGDFADKIGQQDVGQVRHLGWCIGVGDTRRVTFQRLIDDGNFEQ